jgi:hypothetical protein
MENKTILNGTNKPISRGGMITRLALKNTLQRPD